MTGNKCPLRVALFCFLVLTIRCSRACQVFESHKPYPLFSVGVNASHVTVINREMVVFEVHLNQLNLDTHQLHIAEHYRPKSLFSKWPALNQSDVSESISNGRDVFTATFGSKLFLNVIDFGAANGSNKLTSFGYDLTTGEKRSFSFFNILKPVFVPTSFTPLADMLMITAPESSEQKVVSRVAVNEYNQTVSWTGRNAASSSAFDLCSPADHCQSVPRIVGAFNFNRTMYLFGSDHMVYIVVAGKDGLNFERNQSISFEHFFICSKDTAVVNCPKSSEASMSDMILKVAIWIVFFFAVMLLIVVMLTSCDDQPRVFQSELAVDVIKTQLKHVKKHRSSSGDDSRHQLTGDGGRPKQSNSSRSHPEKILTGNSSARSKSKTQRKTLFTTLLRSRRLKTLKTTANTAVKSRKTRGKSVQKSSDKSISEKNNSLAKRVKNYVSTSERPVMKTTVSGKSRAKERTKSIKGSLQSRSRSARSSKSASKSKSKSNSSKK